MAEAGTGPGVRLAELLAVLSLGTDLGLGQPMEHVQRQTLIALRLADRLGLGSDDCADLYYAGLLAWVGCHADAHEQARWLGDDIAAKDDARLVDTDSARADAAFLLSHLGAGRPFAQRVRIAAGFVVGGGFRDMEVMLGNHCLATDQLAEELGLGDGVRTCLRHSFERFDGRGPFRLAGESTVVTARLIALGDVLSVYHRLGGVDAAIAVARERSGTAFDPALVRLLDAAPGEVFGGLDAPTWERVIAAEPTLERRLSDPELGRALEAVADFTDLKSPYLLGHSRAVADLACAAAREVGLPDAEAEMVRRAGLLHDIGRLGVSNAIWDKPGPLTPAEVERVRLHPYLTERMLASCAELAPLGALAACHHERLDGSGYPAGLRAEALTPAARILAAADVYRARTEPRPHRPAGSTEEAQELLREEVRAGRLDGDAVDAVLRAAGHRVVTRRDRPAGLTAREVEVLRLLARGLSNKEIAAALVISRKTAGHHVEHIYAKAGISNRTQASLFAVRHGLLA